VTTNLEQDGADVTTNCVTDFYNGLPKTCIDEVNFPLLSKLSGGKDKIDNNILCALLSEMRQIPDCSNGNIDFRFPNDSDRRIVYVPRYNSQSAFMKLAGSKNCRWVESNHSQLGGDDNDDIKNENAAQWLSYYLGKRHEESFLTASTVLGLPPMHRMDPCDAVAMCDEANLTSSQQGIVKKHLRSKFGKKLFIPDYKFRDSVTKNIRPLHYGMYEYMSADAILKKQQPEKVS
jgi:hypothetical protein